MRCESRSLKLPNPCWSDWKQSHEGCAPLPQPLPYPKFLPAKNEENSSFAPMQKHFDTRRRKGSPQARGLTPPLDLVKAMETPPARKGRKKEGALPEPSTLTTAERERRKWSDSSKAHC